MEQDPCQAPKVWGSGSSPEQEEVGSAKQEIRAQAKREAYLPQGMGSTRQKQDNYLRRAEDTEQALGYQSGQGPPQAPALQLVTGSNCHNSLRHGNGSF